MIWALGGKNSKIQQVKLQAIHFIIINYSIKTQAECSLISKKERSHLDSEVDQVFATLQVFFQRLHAGVKVDAEELLEPVDDVSLDLPIIPATQPAAYYCLSCIRGGRAVRVKHTFVLDLGLHSTI